MTGRPTIHDVAERAGVSKSLAAMVFSSPDGVSTARREAVRAAAAELGYTPNAWARSLRSRSGGFVGIIVADFHNPLFTEIADFARQELSRAGVFSFVATASLIAGSSGPELDPEPIQHVLDLKPSSLFIVGGLPNHTPFQSLPPNFPIVVALAAASDLPNAVSVRSDDSQAMSDLVAHLVARGHQRVTYIGPGGRPVADMRWAAACASAHAQGVDIAHESTGEAMDEQSGFEAAQRALGTSPRPTALVCYNDNVAFGVQNAVARALTTGSEPVAVTGYDNTYIAQLDLVSLTSVDQSAANIARTAGQLLMDTKAMAAARGTEVLVTPTVVVRASSDSPASQ